MQRGLDVTKIDDQPLTCDDLTTMPDEEAKPTSKDWIRAVRGTLTQDEFAARIGVARETVARWEAGTAEASTRHLARIMLAFPGSGDLAFSPALPRQTLRQAKLVAEAEIQAQKIYPGLRPTGPAPQTAQPPSVASDVVAHPGLIRFLSENGNDLTPREQKYLLSCTIREEPEFNFNDPKFWWTIVKLVLRGNLAPPTSTPAATTSRIVNRRWIFDETQEMQRTWDFLSTAFLDLLFDEQGRRVDRPDRQLDPVWALKLKETIEGAFLGDNTRFNLDKVRALAREWLASLPADQRPPIPFDESRKKTK